MVHVDSWKDGHSSEAAGLSVGFTFNTLTVSRNNFQSRLWFALDILPFLLLFN